MKFPTSLARAGIARFRRFQERDRNVLTFIYYGLLYDTVVNMWKPFGVKFLQRLGGTTLEISLFTALPGLAAAAVLIPGTLFLARLNRKKTVTAGLFFVSRLLLLALAAVPFIAPDARPLSFVVLVSMMNLPDALSQTALQGFLGQVFDGRARASAIAYRNKFGSVMVPVVTLATGLVISRFGGDDARVLAAYQIFFVAAFAVGLAEIITFLRFRENPPGQAQVGDPAPMGRVLRTVARNQTFRRYVLATLVFTFFWQAGWPLCNIYQVINLRSDELWMAVYAVAVGLGSFFAAGFWRRFLIRRGNGQTLLVTFLLMALNLLFYPLTPNVAVMALVNVYAGFANIGLAVTLLNSLLAAVPDVDRLAYLGVYNTLTNLSLFAAPLFSALIHQFFGLTAAFLVCVAGRAAAAGMVGIGIWKKRRMRVP